MCTAAVQSIMVNNKYVCHFTQLVFLCECCQAVSLPNAVCCQEAYVRTTEQCVNQPKFTWAQCSHLDSQTPCRVTKIV